MMRRPVRAGRVTALLAAAFAALAARADAQETVPREVVDALYGDRGSGELLVGRLPERFPSVAPEGARVVGSLVSRRHATVAFAVAQPPEEARAAFERRLVAAGLTVPPDARQTGFVYGFGGVTEKPFCEGDSTTVSLDVSERPAGGSYVRLSRHAVTPRMMSPCSRRQEQRAMVNPEDSPIPALHPPAGAELRGGGSGAGIGRYSAETQLDTRASAAEILAHYAAQLQKAGWTPGAPTLAEGLATQTFHLPVTGEQAWHGMLSVMVLPGTDRRAVEMSVYELPPPEMY